MQVCLQLLKNTHVPGQLPGLPVKSQSKKFDVIMKKGLLLLLDVKR